MSAAPWLKTLLRAGHSVVIYDNLCHGHRSMLPSAATFVEGDLANRELLQNTLAAGSFDGVMHFAALIEAGESMQKPEIYFRSNSAGTLTPSGSHALHRRQAHRLLLHRRALRRA